MTGASLGTGGAGRARLGRYLPYLFRDYLMRGGVAVVLFGLLMAGFPLAVMATSQPAGWLRGEGQVAAQQMIAAAVPTIAFLGTLLAVNGIVSDDRRHGYFRFLFAKPVGVIPYYATSWTVNGVGLVVLVAVLTLLAITFAIPLPLGAITGVVALHYLSLGALGFLLSTAVRLEWVLTALLWQGALVVPSLYAAFPRMRAVEPLLTVMLPPSAPLGRVVEVLWWNAGWNALPQGAALVPRPLPMDDLRHVLLFGVACLALAFFQLRRRPLSP